MAKPILPDAPLGVIDIGSNSVRLVGYSGTARVPLPIYNERAFCRLGNAVEKSGRIEGEPYDRAIETLRRFAKIAKQLGVAQVSAFATAAVREAQNRDAFIAEASAILGVPVQVLSGGEEARYSATGVMLAIPDADGIVADLGGGSLELARVKAGKVAAHISLPLGILRLQSGEKKHIKHILNDAVWLGEGKGLPLYIVGGTWRNLMRVHQAQTDYPLNILHHYYVKAQPLKKFCKEIAAMDSQSIAALEASSVNRQENLPSAALLLRQLMKRIDASRAVLSAYAVREGALYYLREKNRDVAATLNHTDPLFAACEEMSSRLCKSPAYGQELMDWTHDIYAHSQTETFTAATLERLRRAACLISDIAWSQHPNFRAASVSHAVLTAPFVGITHNERVFLSYALSCRHEAYSKPPNWKALRLTMKDEKLARALGLSFRLAHSLSASLTGVLPATTLTTTSETIDLQLLKSQKDLHAPIIDKRLKMVAKALGVKAELNVQRV
ncbi:MAG: Ppx/GppA family phosphatase [Alphaproteobacteria bacterium]|nr:Ppx/GppA family phosphatase [Alphaproteobacteria bacterium]MBE8220943.1 Ppx/GppA family phosphatase [Alphaproteobacteria bacterium]